MAFNALKKGSFHWFVYPKWSQDHFWENTFLTHLQPIYGRKTIHFQVILCGWRGQNGLQWAQNGLISCNWFMHPKWSRIIFGNTQFSPIFDPFFVRKHPIFKAF